jgi:hypothetical protein
MKRKGYKSYHRGDYEDFEEYNLSLKDVKKQKQKNLNKKINSAIKSKNIAALMEIEDSYGRR